jgi:hypothetical protein
MGGSTVVVGGSSQLLPNLIGAGQELLNMAQTGPAAQFGEKLGGAIYEATRACPKNGDGGNDCEKQQKSLKSGKTALLGWKFTGLTLPQRVLQAADYNEQVRELCRCTV